MALKKLPKWAIKQAGGINKKAWRLARGKRRKSVARKRKRIVSRRASRGSPRKFARRPMGIVGKINAALSGLRLALPAYGAYTRHGLSEGLGRSAVLSYTGYDIEQGGIQEDQVVNAAGFYSGFIAEKKVMSMLKTPQMAGRKKIMSIVAQYLPELLAVPKVVQGDIRGAATEVGRKGMGYSAPNHQSWTVNANVRNEWLQTMGTRVGLSLASRFIGPFVNKYLPKGVNL